VIHILLYVHFVRTNRATQTGEQTVLKLKILEYNFWDNAVGVTWVIRRVRIYIPRWSPVSTIDSGLREYGHLPYYYFPQAHHFSSGQKYVQKTVDIHTHTHTHTSRVRQNEIYYKPRRPIRACLPQDLYTQITTTMLMCVMWFSGAWFGILKIRINDQLLLLWYDNLIIIIKEKKRRNGGGNRLWHFPSFDWHFLRLKCHEASNNG
jgi:hypothetical protein